MGCNCSGGANQTIAAYTRQAAFRAAGSPLGFDRSNPLLIGETGDGEVWRVRVIAAVEGLSVGQAAFVTGKGVRAYLDSGALFDISSTEQKKRLYKVGAFTYTSLQDANRAAAGTSQPVIEVA